jgi:hypothetical protein
MLGLQKPHVSQKSSHHPTQPNLPFNQRIIVESEVSKGESVTYFSMEVAKLVTQPFYNQSQHFVLVNDSFIPAYRQPGKK